MPKRKHHVYIKKKQKYVNKSEHLFVINNDY